MLFWGLHVPADLLGVAVLFAEHAAAVLLHIQPQLAGLLLSLAEAGTLEASFAEIAENPSRLAEFVTKAGILESYAKKGKEKILDYLNNGTEVPGFRRVSRKGTDTVAPEDVAKYATWIGVPKLLKSYGPLKADIFRALFAEALPEQQFPEELVRTGAGSSYVKKISVSKTTTNK